MEIIRPLIVHGIIIVGAFERHAISRNALKKASMSDGAARITWIGAAVNLLLAFFKLFAGICDAPGSRTHGSGGGLNPSVGQRGSIAPPHASRPPAPCQTVAPPR